MNSECKNYPMKEFRAIFSISSILVIRSGYAKKDHISILAVIQKIWDLHLGCRFEFRTQKLPYEKISDNFLISSNLVIRSGYAKKDHISILAVIQKIWEIWVADLNSERKNYPMKEFRAIFSISSILVIRSGYAKEDHISLLAVIQKIWDLHKFGLQIWIQNAKITLWKNFGQFFRFHQFWSSGPRMRKKASFLY